MRPEGLSNPRWLSAEAIPTHIPGPIRAAIKNLQLRMQECGWAMGPLLLLNTNPDALAKPLASNVTMWCPRALIVPRSVMAAILRDAAQQFEDGGKAAFDE